MLDLECYHLFSHFSMVCLQLELRLSFLGFSAISKIRSDLILSFGIFFAVRYVWDGRAGSH